MLESNLLIVLSLLFGVSMLTMLSEKLNISYPIFLVLAGLAISLVPGIPTISLKPEIIFIIFLPPLLYEAAWNTSWKDFWGNRSPIGFLAFGLVIFTAMAVALVAHYLIPDFPLALGFLLGGIVSPPDAVAATSVLKGLRVPKNIMSILEGESLVNDASSLIVFRFALAAMLTGHFTLMEAGTNFLTVAILGILIGLAIAHLVYAIHRFLPTNPSIDTAISLISPYLMYIIAEHFHYSGVLAVVSGGLFLSFRSHDIFAYDSRIALLNVWRTLVFMLNGLVFILIGLQLPEIIQNLGSIAFKEALVYGLVISLVTIATRIIWIFPAAFLSNLFIRKLIKDVPKPTWKSSTVIAWAGMRGAVSLASALAVPLTLSENKDFPYRDLILFITFVVILITLVFQGLSLPWVIKMLKLEVVENHKEQSLEIKVRLGKAALQHLESNYMRECEMYEAYNREMERYKKFIELANKTLEGTFAKSSYVKNEYKRMLLELVKVRRDELSVIRKEQFYDDELVKKEEYTLDLEEARLRR
ncbi:monovalent cation:H+ antiporter, CPA1 family [Pseudarcicella hirudinis]|uniref:Monovalent cation:H+ antiporter, CPA1 family n=1 Tax=Pseudarcicella hirudinis TaxID=1079859 RepID=A0A1I5M2U5_9BACT|nr:Na+/H+ antiporter [Pseudarcicella hirudinis]SFP03849.1 monovalent cation:H+ antiporter, CPA1 family [Pseudarcicella hirudinis]